MCSLASPPQGGPGRGSGLSFAPRDRTFWVDSGPDPGCYIFFNVTLERHISTTLRCADLAAGAIYRKTRPREPSPVRAYHRGRLKGPSNKFFGPGPGGSGGPVRPPGAIRLGSGDLRGPPGSPRNPTA